MKSLTTRFKSILGLSLGLSMATTAGADVTAFPGALGFGANATGGRAGSVYHVTNLNDSGTGSFRDAVSSPNRIVVFDVSGQINISSAIQVKSNITIAGQTAPGEGVGICGGKVSCGSQSNIIIRHMRFRPGSETASKEDDALNMYRAQNCIIDHCSIEFAPWNNVGGSGNSTYKSTDITFQYCLIADPIYQQFGAHIESVSSQWTWFGNCFANTHNRNPLDKVNDIFVNNLLYNYQGGYTTHTSTKFSHDIVNNYFVGGPNSGSTDNTWYQVDKNQSIYYSGNMKDRDLDGVLDGAVTTPYWYQGTGTVLSAPWSSVTNTLPMTDAATACRMVSSIAGCRPLDDMDELIWSQVQSLGTSGSMYTSQTGTGLGNSGWGTIESGTAPTDTDGDGMPDYWENALDLDNSKNDAMTLRSDGYANIEAYINWLGGLHEQTNENVDLSVNLADYCSGWSKITATYKVGNAVNGVVSISGSTVTFTPDVNFYGLGSFDYTVNGNDGTSYTATIYVLVLKGDDVVLGPPTLEKRGGGSSSQTVEVDGTLSDFSYAWTNAKTVMVTWEPMTPEGITVTVDNSSKLVSFSGAPSVSGTYKFTVTTVSGNETEATATGTLVVGDGTFPAATLQKQGGGSSRQTVYSNSSITDFRYQWFNATGVVVTWEPSQPTGIVVTIDSVNNLVKFTGTVGGCDTYNFTVTTVGPGAEDSKSGYMSVVSRSHIFSCDTTNSDWTSTDYWNTGMVPTDCDTAVVHFGEVNAVDDIRAITYVEDSATFRVRTNLAVKELHMTGGQLKSYTSNPQFRLTATSLIFEADTKLLVGSTSDSEFKLSGNVSGSGNINKTGVGFLTQNANFDAYTGRWTLSEGAIYLTNTNGLGTNGIDLLAGTNLVVSTANTTGSISAQESSTVNLDADLTVAYATLGGVSLPAGTYTAADYPDFLFGSYSLIVTEGGVNTGIAMNVAPMAVSLYPNPAFKVVNLQFSVAENRIITIADITGRVMISESSSSESVAINVSSLAAGIYNVIVADAGETKVLKLIKSK